jgi:hypothetical protein
MAPVLEPLLANPIYLRDEEFPQLVDFVRNGVLDPRAKPGESPEARAEERPQRGVYPRIPTPGFLAFSLLRRMLMSKPRELRRIVGTKLEDFS